MRAWARCTGAASQPIRSVGWLRWVRRQVGPPDSVRPPAALDYQGIGRGFAAYPELAALPGLKIRPEDARALPDAREIAWLGALRLGQGEGIDPAELQPLYLRDKVALTEAERAARSQWLSSQLSQPNAVIVG